MSIITPRSQLTLQTPNLSQAEPDKTVPRPGLFARLRTWIENDRARHALARCQAFDPRFARDIGLSPNDIHDISSAPFWVPLPRRTIVTRSNQQGR